MTDLKWILIKQIGGFDDQSVSVYYFLYGFDDKNISYSLVSSSRQFFHRNKSIYGVKAEDFESVIEWGFIYQHIRYGLKHEIILLMSGITNKADIVWNYAEDPDIDLYSLIEGVLSDPSASSDSCFYVEIKYNDLLRKIIGKPCKISDPKLAQIVVDFFNSKI